MKLGWPMATTNLNFFKSQAFSIHDVGKVWNTTQFDSNSTIQSKMDESAEALLVTELDEFCNSEFLSEDGLREIFERHEVTPNNEYAGDFFFWACNNERVTEGIFRLLLEYFPAAARDTDEDGWTPLHVACVFNKSTTIGIVQLLIDAAPDSVRSVDSHGNMLLHLLCPKNSTNQTAEVEITELLIEKYPEAVRHADNDGYLPIHMAASFKSPELCQVLIEAYPGSEQNMTNNIGMLLLHFACYHGTADTVEYLYDLYPDAINHADKDGYYPIHGVFSGLCKRDNPEGAIEIVQYLLDCDPNVKLQKHEGDSLLQYACQHEYNDSYINAGIEIIKLIYDAHPEAIEGIVVPVIQYWYPQVQPFIYGQLIYARQAKNLRLMTRPDENGQLPLHRALQYNVRLGSIKLLVKGNHHALQSPDNSGALPLHMACQHHDSASVIRYLVGLDTSTLEVVDTDGNSALHYACRGARLEIIALLLDEFGAVSVSKRNTDKKLAIDLLWESDLVSDRESIEYIDSVYRLMRAYPETAMSLGAQAQSTLAACPGENGKKRKFGHV